MKQNEQKPPSVNNPYNFEFVVTICFFRYLGGGHHL